MRKTVLFLFLTSLYLFPFIVFSQVKWHNFTTDENTPNAVFQDDLVWLTNHGGLTRYNRTTGESFVLTPANSGLPSNKIKDLKQDVFGNLWVISDQLVCKFDGTDFMIADNMLNGEELFFLNEIQLSEAGNAFVMASNAIGDDFIIKINQDGELSLQLPSPYTSRVFFVESDSVMWFELNNDEFTRFSPQDTTVILNLDWLDISNPVTTKIMHAPDGNIYILNATFSGASLPIFLSKFSNSTWETFDLGTIPTTSAGVSNAFFDENNIFWASISGFQVELIIQFDGTEITSFQSPVFNVLGLSHTLLNKSADGNFWYYKNTYSGNRLFEYDGVDLVKHNISAANLPSNAVRGLGFGKDGKVWAMTFSGISSFDGVSWVNHRSEINSNMLNKIRHMKVADDGAVWICATPNTDPGYCLANFDGDDWEFISLGMVGNNYVRVTNFDIDSEGNIWAVTYDGLYKYDGVSSEIYDSSNSNLPTSVREVKVSKTGEIWVGTGAGLYKFDGTDFLKIDEFPYDVDWIYEDNLGNLWLKDDDQIGMYDGNSITFFDDSNSPLFSLPTSWTINLVSMSQDKNGIYWFATAIGLFEYDGLEWILHNEGYSRGYQNDLKIDDTGNKWVPTDFGITVFNEDGIRGMGTTNHECLTGEVFLDVDGDGQQSNQEVGLPQQKVVLKPENTVFISSNLGRYNFEVEEGKSYGIDLDFDPAEWNLTSDSASYSVISEPPCIGNLDFGLNSNFDDKKGQMQIVSSFPRCFSQVTVWISTINTGYVPLNGVIEVILDPLTTFIEANPSPIEVNGNTLTFEFSDLPPFHQFNISITTEYPGIDQIGESISVTATLKEMATQTQLDEEIFSQIMVCSYDPNDKQGASTGETMDSLSLFKDDLEYLIRFENTGNDTAFTVFIRDTLDVDLDLNSFELLGASHPVEVTMRGQAVEFRFSNILLLWTDIDPIASQGFVKYKIRAKEGLPDYTRIENTAHIYFDFNPAIVTNTTENTLVDEFPGTPVNDLPNFENGCMLSLYPNPLETSAVFQFDIFHQDGHFQLYDAFGREVLSRSFSGERFVFERGGLSSGVYFYWIKGEVNCNGKLVLR